MCLINTRLGNIKCLFLTFTEQTTLAVRSRLGQMLMLLINLLSIRKKKYKLTKMLNRLKIALPNYIYFISIRILRSTCDLIVFISHCKQSRKKSNVTQQVWNLNNPTSLFFFLSYSYCLFI